MARGAEGASLTVVYTNGSPVLALSATFQGVRSAPTGTVGDAANGRRSMQKTSPGTHRRVPHAVFCDGRTQHHPLSAPIAKNRNINGEWGTRICVQTTVTAAVPGDVEW